MSFSSNATTLGVCWKAVSKQLFNLCAKQFNPNQTSEFGLGTFNEPILINNIKEEVVKPLSELAYNKACKVNGREVLEYWAKMTKESNNQTTKKPNPENDGKSELSEFDVKIDFYLRDGAF